ncbi:MAG: CHAT domain-containing protein, partial [Treponema sp.]|nr:CHAT domain-containing protein [Treponema sp.]
FVNLSACQTGLSGLRSGEGFEGLSRAFLQAGASQVGVTLWSVDDEATSAFMVSLYKKTHSGLSYKDAYKKTKDEFKKSEKWSAPYYWAAFVIYE